MLAADTIEPAVGFDLHSFAIFLHILLFTYWLGSDIGVFYSSRYVVNPTVSPQGRAIAMKIMHMVDLAPRVCLILMLPSGVTLMAASPFGRDIFAGWPLALVWIGGLVWLGVMLAAFFRTPAKHAELVAKADWVVRSLVTVGLLAAAGYTFVVDKPFGVDTNPKWLAHLLEPLLEHQLSGQYPNDYSMHDLGAHFPNATGHPDGKDEYMPVEECGNMLIMALALANALKDEVPGFRVVSKKKGKK